MTTPPARGSRSWPRALGLPALAARPPRQAKAQAEIAEYAQKVGYSAQEISTIADHRAVLVLNKAMLYERAVARRAAGRQPGAQPKVTIAPSRPTGATRPNAQQQRLATFNKRVKGADTGTGIEAAVDFLVGAPKRR